MSCDTRKETDRHGLGQKIGDPIKPKKAGCDEKAADQQSDVRGTGIILGATGSDERPEAAGENRCDRRIGAAGQEPVAAEDAESDRAGNENKETDLRRKAGQFCRGHLFGDGNRGEHKAGEEICRDEGSAIAGEGLQYRPNGMRVRQTEPGWVVR